MSEHNDTNGTALAHHLLQLAEQHKLPVQQEWPLSERLSQVPPIKRIPDPVFAALATVLGFLQHESAAILTRRHQGWHEE